MGFLGFLKALFGRGKPKPATTFIGQITVVSAGDRKAIGGLKAELKINGVGAALPFVYQAYRARFTIPRSALGWGADVTFSADGFASATRHLDHLDPEMGDVELRKKGTARERTRAQLMLWQGNLMHCEPRLKPNFDENGYDARLKIRRADPSNGQVARGIEQGHLWTLTIGRYPYEERQVAYASYKAKGWTDWALHVGQDEPPQASEGYHGIYPETKEEAEAAGERLNMLWKEIEDAGLTPVAAGVSPDARPARGFDCNQVRKAMTDWDNSYAAASRIKAVHDAFPNALVFYEMPGPDAGQFYPLPSPDDVIAPTPTNGGAWIRTMQQKYPRFVGVLHEVNLWDGVDVCVEQLTRLHTWWRDLPECAFELTTYDLFWNGGPEDKYDAATVQLRARCPWLKGYMSGGPSVPVPGDEDGPVVPGTGHDDMIPVNEITFVGGPNIGAFQRTTAITRLELRLSGIYIEFDKKDGPDRWPDIPFGDGGSLQFSFGLVVKVDGRWYAAAPAEEWYGRPEEPGAIQAQNSVQRSDGSWTGQIQGNWFDGPRWSPLHTRQPQPGEEIGLFVCAGDARNSNCPREERSNIVRFPLPADGATLTLTWE